MRLFVAVRPPPGVLDALAALSRPTGTRTRWTSRDQWHVTLRFFGEIDDPEPIVAALSDVWLGAEPCDVTMGPRAGVLDRQIVYLPVTGLDDLAATVVAATADFGEPPPRRRFRGHLTLGRTKGGVAAPSALAVERSWTVRDIELIRSHLGRHGARYETLQRFGLDG